MPRLSIIRRRSGHNVRSFASDPPLAVLRRHSYQRQLLLYAALPHNAHD